MTSKTTTNLLDSPPFLSNHNDSNSPTTDLSTSSSSSTTSYTVNGPTCDSEVFNHRHHLATAAATTSSLAVQPSSTTYTVSSIKDNFAINTNMSYSVSAPTNVPISKHLLRNRDLAARVREQKKIETSASTPSSFHVSFDGLGRDSFRLTNSDRTGFIDLAAAAAATVNNGRGSLITDGGDCGNHNGTASPLCLPKSNSSSKLNTNSLVLRSGSAANLRHRPYSINHKSTLWQDLCFCFSSLFVDKFVCVVEQVELGCAEHDLKISHHYFSDICGVSLSLKLHILALCLFYRCIFMIQTCFLPWVTVISISV